MTDDGNANFLAAAIGITDEGKAHRLIQDVRLAARVFDREPHLRPSRLQKELADFVGFLETRPNDLPSIPSHLHTLLGVAEDYEADALLADRWALMERAREALKSTEHDRTIALDKKGGRARDERLDCFANSLAQIYRTHTGKRSTFTISPDRSEMVSAYCRFAYEAIHQFCPAATGNEGALRGALQQTVRFENTVEPMTDAEVDALLSF